MVKKAATALPNSAISFVYVLKTLQYDPAYLKRGFQWDEDTKKRKADEIAAKKAQNKPRIRNRETRDQKI